LIRIKELPHVSIRPMRISHGRYVRFASIVPGKCRDNIERQIPLSLQVEFRDLPKIIQACGNHSCNHSDNFVNGLNLIIIFAMIILSY
jgi:hypothetical protein